MNGGICYLIHNKEEYKKNRKRIIKVIEKANEDLDVVFNASVIEFREDLYLVVDCHSSFSEYDKKLAKIINPFYKEDPEKAENINNMFSIYTWWKDIMDNEGEAFFEKVFIGFPPKEQEKLKGIIAMIEKGIVSYDNYERKFLYEGLGYDDPTFYVYKMFNIEEDEKFLEELSASIFKATTEKTSIGEVKFVETLYDIEEHR